MAHHIELNGDCVAVVVNKTNDGGDFLVKLIPGPEPCTINPLELLRTISTAIAEFVSGGGEFIES